MEIFKIEITETLSRIVAVPANSQEDAIDIMKEKYSKQEIVLDASDFKDVNYEVAE